MNNDNWNGEVKINKDILKYSEQFFMGLSVKQTVSGAAALIVAALVYYFCYGILGQQLTIILCAVLASPFAAIGFLSYNGLTFVQLVKAVIQHFLMPDKLFFRAKNFYSEIIKLNKFLDYKERKITNAKKLSKDKEVGKKLVQNTEECSADNTN